MGKVSAKIEEWDYDDLLNEDDVTPIRVPREYRHINAKEIKAPVEELWERYKKGNLVLDPDFQRHYVWDDNRASRYIESLLLELPTPPVFMAEETNGEWTVIDGHQRLGTLFRFMRPLLRHPSEVAHINVPFAALPPLILKNLEVLDTELNGRGVEGMSTDDRIKLWKTPITIILLPKTADSKMKYVLFARLNLGSMSLNNQELRNCLYKGVYSDFIGDLSENQQFLKQWGKSYPDKRMRHRELVLRFFAFLHMRDKYEPPYRTFLNREMEENQSISKKNSELYRRQFASALKWTEIILGKEAFRQFRIGDQINHSGRWVARRYELVYEFETVGFAEFATLLENFWNEASIFDRDLVRLIIRNRLVHVMSTNRFVASMKEGTTRPTSVESRFEPWLQTLEEVTRDFEKTLDYARALHSALNESSICAWCPIQVMPDEAVLVSIGNKQRVAHQYCRIAHSSFGK